MLDVPAEIYSSGQEENQHIVSVCWFVNKNSINLKLVLQALHSLAEVYLSSRDTCSRTRIQHDISNINIIIFPISSNNSFTFRRMLMAYS
jgi:hypothetical protein